MTEAVPHGARSRSSKARFGRVRKASIRFGKERKSKGVLPSGRSNLDRPRPFLVHTSILRRTNNDQRSTRHLYHPLTALLHLVKRDSPHTHSSRSPTASSNIMPAITKTTKTSKTTRMNGRSKALPSLPADVRVRVRVGAGVDENEDEDEDDSEGTVLKGHPSR
jgi:hypothetical protein